MSQPVSQVKRCFMATITERTSKDGTVSYRTEVRIAKKGATVYRETRSFAKRKLAEQWAAKLEAEMAEPGKLEEVISGKSKNNTLTLSELIDRYVSIVYPLKPWGRSKTATLLQIQKSDIGQKVATRITAKDIIHHCRNWGAGPATVNQHYIYIRGVFGVARELLGCDVSFEEVEIAQRTMSKVGIVSKSDSRERRPEIEELDRVVSRAYRQRKKWEALANTRGLNRDDLIPMDKVILFAMFSGRRQAEICSISRKDTDYERHRVLIRQMKHPTKKDKNDVWCYVPDEAWAILMTMPKKDGDDRWFPYFSRTLGDRLRQLLKDTGQWNADDAENNLRFHDLRHECISWLFERDGWQGERWDIARVASVSGHQSWNMLQRYTRMDRLEPYNKWAEWEWLTKVLG